MHAIRIYSRVSIPFTTPSATGPAATTFSYADGVPMPSQIRQANRIAPPILSTSLRAHIVRLLHLLPTFLQTASLSRHAELHTNLVRIERTFEPFPEPISPPPGTVLRTSAAMAEFRRFSLIYTQNFVRVWVGI